MKSVIVIALALVVSVVNSQTFPDVSFMGKTLANHSYVNISQVGNDPSRSDSVKCITDLTACCSSTDGPHRGDWYFPNVTRLLFSGDIYEHRGTHRVDLRRTNSANSPVGIYRCAIPTNAVHDDIDTTVRDTVYVGLYSTDGGVVTISGEFQMTFSEVSDLNGASPQFILTCISTGGPATTITWTRDSTTVTQGTQTVLNDPVTAQYTHTLTVTGRLGGLYTCTIANNKPSTASANFTVEVASPPTDVLATQEGVDSTTLSWKPVPGATGYLIYYESSGGHSHAITNGSASTYILTGLQNGQNYTLSVAATSNHFPSGNSTTEIGLVPGRPNVSMVMNGANTSVFLSWSIPSGSVVTSLEVKWFSDQCLSKLDEGSDIASNTSTAYAILHLRVGTSYNITVSAINPAGTSPSHRVTVDTEEKAPASPPLPVNVIDVATFTVTVQWGTVSCPDQNGVITGYTISISRMSDSSSGNISGSGNGRGCGSGSGCGSGHGNGSGLKSGRGIGCSVPVIEEGVNDTASVSVPERNATLTGLRPSTNYSITVAAVNSAGIGKQSEPLFVVTDGVLSVTNTTSLSAKTLTIEWELVEGVTAATYTIFYYNTDTDCFHNDTGAVYDVGGGEQMYTLTGLEEGSTYSVTVMATLCGLRDTEEDSIIATTMPAVPSVAPLYVEVFVENSTTVTVTWGPVDCVHENGKITHYSVRYREVDRSKHDSGGSGWNNGLIEMVSEDPSGEITTILSGLTKETVYTVEIAAQNTAGIGVYSNPKSFQTPNDVYISLNHDIIQNHGLVVVNNIGFNYSTSLHCHYDEHLDANCELDWFTPNGSRITDSAEQSTTSNTVVSLTRTTAFATEGIYHCAVCNGNASRKVYIGIYPVDKGLIQISGNVTFVLDSNPNEATPQFRLGCISTGGPATTVTWSRDSETLSQETESVLNDATTAQYTHTLTVTGKLEGLYACSVANEISNDSAQLNVTAPSPPSDVKFVQNGLKSLLVSWTSGMPAVTGYVVHYREQNGEHNGSVTVEGSESGANITGLNPGTNYSMEIVATSSTLPSDATLKYITIEQASISLYATPSYLVEAGHNVTLTCSVSLPKDVAGTPVYDWEGPADNFDPALFECDEDPCRSVTLYDVDESHAGLYTCSVSLGGSISTYTNITVVVNIPVPSIVPSSLMAGTVDNLTCSYYPSYPLVEVSATWTFNGSAVEPDDSNRVTLDGVNLMLSRVTTSDSGTYTCTLNITSDRQYAIFQTPDEATANVTVAIPPPDVQVSLRSGLLYVGTSLTLSCTVTIDSSVNNNESVTIEWIGTQGGRVSLDNTLRASENTYERNLTISPLSMVDSGAFTCTGTITGGSGSVANTHNITIQVIDLPDPNVTLSTTIGVAGEAIELICTVTTAEYLSESAILSVTWSGGSVGHSGVTQCETSSISMSTLMFSPMNTSHGGGYSCKAVIDIPALNITKTGVDSADLIVQIPSPLVVVHAPERELVAGSSLSLSCTITPLSVDTPTTIASTWTTPNTTLVQNAVNDTSVDLIISNVKTADSGVYICSSTVIDSTSSMYIMDSEPGRNSTAIIVKLNVSIRAVYNPAPGDDVELLGPNTFTAGSDLELLCVVMGNSNNLQYSWSVNQTFEPSCIPDKDCDINVTSTTSKLRVGKPVLSYYAGTYTCTVNETHRPESQNSHDFTVNVVGAGIYALISNETISSGPIANNGLIVSTSSGFRLECVSNSNKTGVGIFTTPKDVNITMDTAGIWKITNNPFSRPGVLQVQNETEQLTASDQGICTCTISDVNGKHISLNVGVYPSGFNKPPQITSLAHQAGNRTLTCVSTDSPATVVTWMKDGQPLTTDGSFHYTLSQGITNRTSSAYSNVLIVRESAPGVAGTYSCNVTNDLGSDSKTVVAVGITITGLESPLIVGESATISCITNEHASVIVWSRQSSQLNVDVNVTVLNYTIPMVSDDLQGETFTCTAVVSNTNDTESVMLSVEVPAGSLMVEGIVSDLDLMEAGGIGPTLTCTVTETILGLTNMPSAIWVNAFGPGDSTAANDNIIRNATTAVTSLSFPELHTSHAGLYTCRGVLNSSGVDDGTISISSSPAPVIVQLPAPNLIMMVPSGPLYQGTTQTLNCTVTLPPSVDTDVSITVHWSQNSSTERVTITRPSTMMSPFISTLTISPLAMTDTGQYSCEAIARSSSEYINSSTQGHSQAMILSVTALPPPNVTITVPITEVPTAGQSYTLNCSATTVVGLVVQPDMKIVFPNSTAVALNNTSSVIHTFSPLRTSDGGQYNCTATLNIPQAQIRNLQSSVVMNITVAVPKPNVTISGNISLTELYSATVFTLTCRVEVLPEVDTTLTVLTTWSKAGDDINDNNRSRISADGIATQNSSVMHVYESALVFNPLSNTDTGGDSGSYKCSVTIKDDRFLSGITANATHTIALQDLRPPIVNVRPFGSSTAGETYSLQCSVETVEGVRSRDISISWTTPNRTTVMSKNMTTTGRVTRGSLIFSRLTTSHSGQYICTGRISAETVGVNVSKSFSFTVNVSIPAPNVSVSDGKTSGAVIQGTALVLSCSVLVHNAVNTDFTVSITWSSDPIVALNGQRATVSETKGSGQEYGSSATIRPVNTSDSANYTCTASILPNEISSVIASNESEHTVDITVQKLTKPVVANNTISSVAGQSFSVDCNFSVTPNLIGSLTVHWNSSDLLESENSKLSFPRLLTSDGGDYTCVVTISIHKLNLSLTGTAKTAVIVQIPAPSVVIERVDDPYNGSVFTLSCIVRVSHSVDTNISISTQWGLPVVDKQPETISNVSRRVAELVGHHNLTFTPLRSQDSGQYECNATISPGHGDTVAQNTAVKLHNLTVQKLPPPKVSIAISSTAGLGSEECLGLVLETASNSIVCQAGVIANLFNSPNISLWRDGTLLHSNSALNLNFTLPYNESLVGEFNCSVCISVPESGIEDYCSNDTVVTSHKKPEAVVALITSTHNNSRLTMNWSHSSDYYSVVRYIVNVRQYVADGPGKVMIQTVRGYPRELSGGQLSHTVADLKPEVPYNVQLVAGNGVGCGKTIRSDLTFTREGAPKIAPGDVEVEWLPNGTAVNVSFTRLTIVEANSIHINYFIRYSSSPLVKRDVDKMTVKVNDGSTTVIGGLDPYLDYHVVVDATNSHGTKSSSPYLLHAALSEDQRERDSTGIVAGIFVVMLIMLVVVLVVGILIFRWRRRSAVKTKPLLSGKTGLYTVRPMKDSEVIELDSRVFPTSQPRPSDPVQAETDTPKPEMDPARMVAIPVEDFKQHCIDYHKFRDAGFEAEYESLAVGPLAVHEVSQMLCNKQKNRFANIYPYDDSRVVLEEFPGFLGSDYTNASWINGYKHPNAYIASQGPKMSTVGDFWRMVWQYKVDHIVMVTGLCEGGRIKCERYWSEEVGGTVEVEEANLKATTTSITTHRDFVIRTMTLKKTTQSDEQPLAVTQYHFTSWPDHGVPRFATSLISFLRRVQKTHNKDSGVPLLVHCSAGVGRTGTFILLDSMLEQIKEQNSINVYEFLVSLRERRVLMVQTLAQYVLVHDALCEVIQCGDTEISASRLNAAVEVMAQSLPGETFTGFQQQFQLLDHVSRKPMEQDFVKAHEHPSKNRYPDRLPYVEFMPCLKPIEIEDSYINASFIDGYKHHRAYIATQGPLQSTVGDMWRMMWEVKSKVMVLLCAFAEDGHEACHPFWPHNEGDTAWYGRMTVTLQSEILMGNFVSRTLLLEGDQVVGQEGEGRVVTQFHMTDWPEHSQPVSTASVLELLDVVTKAQMNSGTRPITVLCNDGVGRSGTFICLHCQLERLKTEGVVDLLQAVKSARIHRAGLVQNAEQYAYCHEVLADFVNSYDNYANFKDLV